MMLSVAARQPPMIHMSGAPTRQAQAVNPLPVGKRTFYGHARIHEQRRLAENKGPQGLSLPRACGDQRP